MSTATRRGVSAGVWITLWWLMVCGWILLTAKLPGWIGHTTGWAAYCASWIATRSQREYWVWATVFALLIAVNGTWLLSVAGQWYRARTRVLGLQCIDPPAPLRQLAAECGVQERILYTPDTQLLSFTVGFVRPKVVLSAGLCKLLDDEELRAVLLHERTHVQGADPLRLTWARAMAKGLWFFPIVRELAKWYHAELELAADRSVIRQLGVGPLASALLKVMEGEMCGSDLAARSVMGFDDCMHARIAQLRQSEGDVLDHQWPVRPILQSGAFVAVYLAWAVLSCW